MSDFEQILNLIARVARSFDEADLDGFLDCWADDGVLNFVDADLKTVLNSVHRQDMAQRFGPAMRAYTEKHFVSLPVIDIDGDQAVARYYTLYPSAGPSPAVPGAGQTRMVLRRQADGRWKVAEQNLHGLSKSRTDVVFSA